MSADRLAGSLPGLLLPLAHLIAPDAIGLKSSRNRRASLVCVSSKITNMSSM